jgi:hypothetical protein
MGTTLQINKGELMIYYGETVLEQVKLTPLEQEKVRTYVNYNGMGVIRDALMSMVGPIDLRISIDDFLNVLSAEYGLKPEDIKRKRPKGAAREGKRIYMFFLVHRLGYSETQVARILDMDRSTVNVQTRDLEEQTKFNPVLSGMFLTAINIYEKLSKHEAILG